MLGYQLTGPRVAWRRGQARYDRYERDSKRAGLENCDD